MQAPVDTRNAGQPPKKRRRPAKKPQAPQPAAPVQVVAALVPSTSSTPVITPSVTPRTSTPAPGESSRGFTTVRFADFATQGLISAQTAAGVASLRPVHEFCTPVQAETLPVILTGVDVLAQAKTGTGKTLAFLIPCIERLLRSKPQPLQGQISVLIMSPTRELAIQIEEAARGLLSATNYAVQHVVGGTNMGSETKRLNGQRCDILVATPGRLIDHLENSDLKRKFAGLRALVLDEADRLLEAGFRRELVRIIDSLPDRKNVPRQTLLFSATVPQQVHQIASLALLPNHAFISTISEADANTHAHVPQHSLLASLNDTFPMTLAAIHSEKAIHGSAMKIMAFLPTARATGLAAALFKRLNLGVEVWEIHSRKSQSQRNAAAETFKLATTGILFSSDVTARGMDFPGVTTVMQVGLPANAEQYIHRLGRTARAGAAGSGIIILAPFESFFLRKREISVLPLAPHPASNTTLSANSPQLAHARAAVRQAMATVDDETKSQHYGASLGFYKSFVRECFGSPEGMVQVMNDYATSPDGLAFAGASGETPPMMASTIGKMGLKGTRGLNIVASLPGKEGGGRGAGGGGRGGGGGGGGRGGGRGAPRGRGGRGRGN